MSIFRGVFDKHQCAEHFGDIFSVGKTEKTLHETIRVGLNLVEYSEELVRALGQGPFDKLTAARITVLLNCFDRKTSELDNEIKILLESISDTEMGGLIVLS